MSLHETRKKQKKEPTFESIFSLFFLEPSFLEPSGNVFLQRAKSPKHYSAYKLFLTFDTVAGERTNKCVGIEGGGKQGKNL